MDNSLFSVFYIREEKSFLYCDKANTAFIYYRDFKIDLLSGERLNSPLKSFLKKIENISMFENFEKPKVFHLFYELGFYFIDDYNSIPEHEPLAISIEYFNSKKISSSQKRENINVALDDYPVFKKYKKQFSDIQNHLIAGDCYQVNLTHPFYFKVEEGLEVQDYLNSFLGMKENLGAYAHFTSLGFLGRVLFSNSPECLFKAYVKKQQLHIRSMPIKGTVKDEGRGSWSRLESSLKDQAELYMIADLIRNDLSKVDFTPARIIKKKLPLRVPGIYHQFSIIETKTFNDVNLYSVLKSLFPGGSITGAPKKRVMGIIKDLESYTRGFYCGSTVLLHKSLRCGSINIRSADIDIDRKEIKYGSGGGITLLSEVDAEFKESYQKMESFLNSSSIKILSKT